MEDKGLILLVDDDDDNHLLTEGCLRDRGYQLVFAANGVDGLVKARELSPDLIILDVMMPGMDGFETCEAIRRDPLLSEVPVIMLTALYDKASRIKGIQAGADEFITRPYDLEEFRARVETVMRLNRYHRLLVERGRFAWAVNQSTDGYLILDSEDRITYANGAARGMLNLPPYSRLSQPFQEHVRRGFTCHPEEAWLNWPAPAPGNMPRYIILPEKEQSRAVWLQVETLYLTQRSRIEVLVCLRNISGRMAMQHEIWHLERAVNHKLRTPLSAMSMSIALLRYAVGENNAQAQELIDGLSVGVNRLSSQMDDITQFSDTSNIAKEGKCFQVSGLQRLADQVCSGVGIQPCTFKMDGEVYPEIVLSIAEHGMEVVLWELLENARKFHPNHEPAVELSVSRQGQRLLVTVADDGVSLTPEQLRRAWVPFYQAEERFTGEVEGMGLGLPTVAVILWEIGGSVRMYNRPDCPGIVVELLLPEA